MRAVIQRVDEASVVADGLLSGSINQGLLVYFGVGKGDTEEDLNYLLRKTMALRVFNDDQNKMNLSIVDIRGEILVVSQFTLYGDVRRGNRPGFDQSAPPETAKKLYSKFVEKLRSHDIVVESGIFAAHMEVKSVGNGPVTILLDSKKQF